jgi:hypothetical protein
VFYGSKWGEFDGKEYIYKAPVGVRIAEMTQRLTVSLHRQASLSSPFFFNSYFHFFFHFHSYESMFFKFTFCMRLLSFQTQFEGQFGKGNVQTLPNKEINRAELNPKIAYFQIGINNAFPFSNSIVFIKYVLVRFILY